MNFKVGQYYRVFLTELYDFETRKSLDRVNNAYITIKIKEVLPNFVEGDYGNKVIYTIISDPIRYLSTLYEDNYFYANSTFAYELKLLTETEIVLYSK